jgi:hypothetical protein
MLYYSKISNCKAILLQTEKWYNISPRMKKLSVIHPYMVV